MTIPIVWGLAAGLLALMAALFSALETAASLWDAGLAKKLRQTFPAAAKRLEKFAASPPGAAPPLAIGDALCNFAVLALGVLLLPFAAEVTRAPVWLMAALWFGGAVAGLEALPKLIALRWPEQVLAWGWPLVGAAHAVFGPSTRRLNAVLAAFHRPAPTSSSPSTLAAGADELAAIAELAAEDGTLRAEEARVFRAVLMLGKEPASHCMTPRVDCFLLPDDLPEQEARERLRAARFQRVPVHGESPDDILGVLETKRVLLDASSRYIELLEPPSFVPAQFPALTLLHNFLSGRRRIALLLDEYGGFEGIVTLSDLLDEILGEAPAEARSSLYIQETAPGQWLASGQARLDDLAETLPGFKTSGQEADTLAGLLMECLGRVPRPGDRIPLGGWQAEVRRASRKQVREVILRRFEDSVEGEPP